MRIGLLSILFLAAPAVWADEVVFYRCTDAAGALTVQNMPCPKGSRQEKRVMQSIATVPMGAPTPAPAVPAAPIAPTASPPSAPPAPAPAVEDAHRLPPPNLFRCTARGEGTYLTEDDEPASRCIPLRTVGLDGNPQGGAGEACEVVRDQCARVPDESLCDAWKKRRDEAEVAWRFTRPETAEKNRAEFERVQRIVNESACSQ